MEYNHISIVSVSPDRCVVKVDLAPDSKNRNGYAHGGLLYAMPTAWRASSPAPTGRTMSPRAPT